MYQFKKITKDKKIIPEIKRVKLNFTTVLYQIKIAKALS